MKRSSNTWTKGAFLAAVGAIAAFGGSALFSPTASAAPGPWCGPIILWLCTFPDGHQQLFGGTVCQKASFEKQTGAHCGPAPL